MKIHFLIIHHTGGTESNPIADTSNQTFDDVNSWHRVDPNVWLGRLSSLGYAIGYHYFIDKTGKVTQGRNDYEQAAHAKGYNNNSWDPPEHSAIGICLAGNFDVSFPTSEQIKSLTLLLTQKVGEYGIPISNIVPHRYVANKSCYGRNLPDDWAANLLRPVQSSSCIAQENEIVALKAKVSWYDKILVGLLKYFRA
jgi:N-acetylmuramoyl-L-alanine amidase